MIGALFEWVSPVVYVRLSPDKIHLRNVRSGLNLSEQPLAAISVQPPARLLAVGDEAKLHASETGVKIFNPFTHPRSLVSDFTMAEQVIKGLVRKLLGSSRYSPSPMIVIHPQVEYAGDFTQVEIRAIRELAMGAGASRVIVWEGRELTDQELLSKSFPRDGRVLE